MVRTAPGRGAGALRKDAAAVADDEGGPLSGGDGAVGPSDVERDAVVVDDDRREVRVAGEAAHGLRRKTFSGAGRRGGCAGLTMEGLGAHRDVQVRADTTRS